MNTNALNQVLCQAVQKGDTTTLRKVFKSAHVNITQCRWGIYQNVSPIHLAVSYANFKSLRCLIDLYKANGWYDRIHTPDSLGSTPLFLLTSRGRNAAVALARLLLDAGADVDHSDVLNPPPVYWATYQNNTKLVMLFHQYGADMTVTYNGTTALHIALEKRNRALIRFLATVNPVRVYDLKKLMTMRYINYNLLVPYLGSFDATPLVQRALRVVDLGALEFLAGYAAGSLHVPFQEYYSKWRPKKRKDTAGIYALRLPPELLRCLRQFLCADWVFTVSSAGSDTTRASGRLG